MSQQIVSASSPPRALPLVARQGIRSALTALNYWQLHALQDLSGVASAERAERIQRAWTLQADWIF